MANQHSMYASRATNMIYQTWYRPIYHLSWYTLGIYLEYTNVTERTTIYTRYILGIYLNTRHNPNVSNFTRYILGIYLYIRHIPTKLVDNN